MLHRSHMIQQTMAGGLEVLHTTSQRSTSNPPLLFVHGAWHGAWCWAEYFLPYFSAQGFDCYAVSLRGHGRSQGRDRLDDHRIVDYVADVFSVAQEIGRTPVLVGHSMGGFIAQKYTEIHPSGAMAMILLSSIPRVGIRTMVLPLLRRRPSVALRAMTDLNAIIRSPQLIRENFFSNSMSSEDIRRYTTLIQRESRAASFDMLFRDLPKTRNIIPTLVLSAGLDKLLPVSVNIKTAYQYNAEYILLNNAPHDSMLDVSWKMTANNIRDWLI